MRRFGERYVPGKPYRDRRGAYALIHDGPWLLLAETESARETILLPGGGIDPGESPLQALHREVMEETGWRIGAPRRFGMFQRYVYMPDYGYWARKVCTIYTARPIQQLDDPIEPDHTPVWMHAKDAVRSLSVSAERHFVERWFNS
ncbi:NUDIX domain-containing protein [Pontivivens insulae]|uniref:RNA pyrophosphohydrolase n=1 Tax=Pontivivens insulae TaxID=1639689 RepID=A0A2R8A793_9RHOB|nr:NUDIX hydrolase [Pontivivens insulae]RED18158.1 8-oxo-dGTP diphosphatase [Pontivivens insulae]SPF28055.1 RNA pyrophosphohydrolase [Pontivivens insulae]